MGSVACKAPSADRLAGRKNNLRASTQVTDWKDLINMLPHTNKVLLVLPPSADHAHMIFTWELGRDLQFLRVCLPDVLQQNMNHHCSPDHLQATRTRSSAGRRTSRGQGS